MVEEDVPLRIVSNSRAGLGEDGAPRPATSGASFRSGRSSLPSARQVGDAERAVDLVDVLGIELEVLPRRAVADGSRAAARPPRGGWRRRSAAGGRSPATERSRSAASSSRISDVGVARDAEGGRAADLHAREELRQVRLDEVLEQQEVRPMRGALRRHRDEARQRRRAP